MTLSPQFPRECPNCKNGWVVSEVPDSTKKCNFRTEAVHCECQQVKLPVLDAKMAAAGEAA